MIDWKEFTTRFPTEQELRDWFEDTNSNIAVVCCELSNLIVLDIDDPNFDYSQLELPPTVIVSTGRGGKHFWFKHPKGLELKNMTRIDGKPMDLRAGAGIAVCPPSIHPDTGKEYKWDNSNPLWGFKGVADAPKWLIDKALTAPKEKVDWAEVMQGVPIGRRNETAASVAGKILLSLKLEDWESVGWPAVEGWNKSNTPPLPLRELRSVFQSVGDKELKRRKDNPKETGEVFTRIGQAKIFIDKQPIYYSPEGLLWFWNFDRCCYELKDETDLLNGIRKEMKIDTVGSRNKAEILGALKQVGRDQAPEIKPKGWIQFKDVLINPKTLERTKADHKYFLTNPIPHKLGESEETPEIDRLLREWVIKEGVQDESHVKSLYEYIAYALTDDLFMQRIIALTGGGSNGKGTFLKVVEQLVGRNNYVAVDMKKLATNNFAMSSIFKKLVAFAGEVGYNDLTNTNVFKKLTGEDLIEYEFKGKTSFTDVSITTLFIATNSLPTTPDKSLGFYRRWAITDFPNTFKIKTDVLSVITEQEYENLCLKCVNILRGLYETGKFTNEGDYEDREQKYEERSNPLPTFIEENCEDEPGAKIKLQEFGNKFNAWLKSKQLKQMTIITAGRLLRNNGYDIGKREFKNEPGTTSASVLNLKLKGINTENTKNTEL